MSTFTIKIEAPELSKAIFALASALKDGGINIDSKPSLQKETSDVEPNNAEQGGNLTSIWRHLAEKKQDKRSCLRQ